MKICVTSIKDSMDSEVDPRFGRCKYFLIIDMDSNNVKTISNESIMSAGGAGIQAAQMVAKTGASIVITGNIGPNAYKTLLAAGIKVITGVNGSIKDIIDKYTKGELNETEAPNVGSHHGIGGR
jgi:predicted Fe-Mo cluster-binding NifX family protein